MVFFFCSVMGVLWVAVFAILVLASVEVEALPEPFRRDPGNPNWHHGNFQDHRDDVRKMTHELIHQRAEVGLRSLLEWVALSVVRMVELIQKFVNQSSLMKVTVVAQLELMD